MKVAIVGGNLLGCASAHYVRRALDAERQDGSVEDEIVIFERETSLGGGKFNTVRVNGVDVITGSAAELDVSQCPLFKSALRDVDITPEAAPSRAWAFFDWDADRTLLASTPIQLLERARKSIPFQMAFHAACALATAKYYALYRSGVTISTLFRDYDDVYSTLLMSGLVLLACAGFGLVPFRWVAGVWNHIAQTGLVNLNAKFNYGTAPSMAGTVSTQIVEHLQVVDENDSCEGAITVGHLLSRCGLAKYAKASALELLEKYYIPEKFRDDFIAPELTYAYAESRFRPSHVANAFAAMLEMATRLKIPTGLRSKAKALTVNQGKTICPKLAGAARARLQVCAQVNGIVKDKDNAEKYALRVKTGHGVATQGGFDAVIIAATVDANEFDLSTVVEDPKFELAQIEGKKAGEGMYNGVAAGNVLRKYNNAAFMSVVVGDLNPQYFRRSTPQAVANETHVVNAIDCAQVVRAAGAERVYRVLSASKLTPPRGPEPESEPATAADRELLKKLFTKVVKVNSWQRRQRAYVAAPLRNINGPDVPAFIIAKRIIFPAAADRVANHVEMDCMAARNVASLFKQGNVTWK